MLAADSIVRRATVEKIRNAWGFSIILDETTSNNKWLVVLAKMVQSPEEEFSKCIEKKFFWDLVDFPDGSAESIYQVVTNLFTSDGLLDQLRNLTGIIVW